MNKEDFTNNLLKATNFSKTIAQRFISNDLPNGSNYIVYNEMDRVSSLNLPNLLNQAEAVDLLYKNAEYPSWVDIEVYSFTDTTTIFLLVYSNNNIEKIEDSVWKDSSIVPFRCKSPKLPEGWMKGDVIDLPRDWRV